jgi:manganese/zinc/iron transport system permease protein
VVNLGVVLLLNALFVLLFYKELKVSAFDPALATTLGINSSAMHYALMIIVAITTVANFEAVGSILVIAMLIVPAAAAHLLTDRLGLMILLSLAIAGASAVLGHVLAFLGPGWVGLGEGVSANTAAMMAVVTGVFLLLALLLSPQYGLISKAYHRLALSLQIVAEDILGLLYRWHELRPREGKPITKDEVLGALGTGPLVNLALRVLMRRRLVAVAATTGRGQGLVLTDGGLARAATLIRSHRLWEAYLKKHFALPLDHLHPPAERMEHYITPALRERLGEALTDPSRDPHGRTIPQDEEA